MNDLQSPPGFARVTAATHPVSVGDPGANCDAILAALPQFESSNVLVFGELSVTGYTCGDLFGQDTLLSAALAGLEQLTSATAGRRQLLVVGLPLRVGGRLYNVAAALYDGRLVAFVPKQYLPNYQEFYEGRWFAPADGSEPSVVRLDRLGDVPFGIDLLLEMGELVVGIELCEDLWMPMPPSSNQALAGANLLLNLSASNELVGKAAWRDTLVRSQSGRCLAGYAYASAGPTESSTDLVFGGHCLVAENGTRLAESERVGRDGCGWLEQSHATADIDLQKLSHDRQVTVSWQQAARRFPGEFRRLILPPATAADGTRRTVSGSPFVPERGPELHERCAEIIGIQCAALAKRVLRLPADAPLNIGVSGGLDSTLALLVAVKTCQLQGWPTTRIAAITMPGFGTTETTLNSARQLMQHLEVTRDEIDIRSICLDTFRALEHQPFGIETHPLTLIQFQEQLAQLSAAQRNDLRFENVQARVRTLLLMSRGFVLGTGDLSEQALGWSTYNGDHMSMYNVNASIPKTLVRFLVRYLAENEFSPPVRPLLHQVMETPISPELLPLGPKGKIHQETEAVIGPYELHDFFLYHLLRFGTPPSRVLHLAGLARFSRDYSREEIRATLELFLKRFFANQFKRSCVPDGPKVGSVSLSPRGDWRMPSDADAAAWLRELESAS